MEKYIYDENNGLWYELQGDYYIPCLTLPAEEERDIGIWGQRHKWYLQEHKEATYTTLLTSGRLNSYLAGIDKQAEDRMLLLTKQMAESEKVTEKLKAENVMLWIGKMNEIQARAREIVYAELIYN
ncbi:MAG: TnpV protein [Proteus hauseri]|nr:TnpV protein [Clostridiales bacterium]MBS6212504.1 TnpV protein [Proteus hauseri]